MALADTITKLEGVYGIQLDANALGLNEPSIGLNPYWTNRFGEAGPSNAINAATTVAGSNPTPTTAPAAGATAAAPQDYWTHLFTQGVVIITGFIFVGVGLSMFREHGISGTA